MAGTWMSLVQGFGGVRIINDQLHIDSILPKSWEKYNFKIIYRNTSINVEVDKKGKHNSFKSKPFNLLSWRTSQYLRSYEVFIYLFIIPLVCNSSNRSGRTTILVARNEK